MAAGGDDRDQQQRRGQVVDEVREDRAQRGDREQVGERGASRKRVADRRGQTVAAGAGIDMDGAGAVDLYGSGY